MGSLLDTIRLVGAGRMLRLFRGRRQMEPLMVGYYTTRALQALFNVGFLDEMHAKERVDPEAFAKVHGLDINVLRPLCDSLFSFRIFKKERDGYSLDDRGQILVGVTRGWFVATYGYEDVVHSLEGLLRREQVYGKDVKRRIECVTEGYAEMEKWVFFPWLFEIVAKKGFKRVLDLGCGDGTFLRALCTENREITGYGVDIAVEAIAEGRRKVEAAGLGGRIELNVADISRLEQIPGTLEGIDAATTFFVLHELLYGGADVVVDLLQGFRARFPGVPLIIFEVARPSAEELRRRPGMGIIYFLHHDLTHQKPVGRDEWRELFKKAGFTAIEEIDLWFARTIIFIVR
jgi:SAM-dependent methyltransferase